MEVYVSVDPNARRELCYDTTTHTSSSYVSRQCAQPIVGQYVLLQHTLFSDFRICEVIVKGKQHSHVYINFFVLQRVSFGLLI